MNWNRCIRAGLIAAFLIAPASAQKSDRAEVLFESARQKEMLEGNLESAIKQYKEVVAKYGSNRAIAAKALVRMGECYEKLGDAEARKAFERVVREFAIRRKRWRKRGSGWRRGASRRRRASSRGGLRKLKAPTSPFQGMGAMPLYGEVILDGIPSQILVHDLVSGEVRPLVTAKSGDEAFMDPLISPDGTQVVYVAYTGHLLTGLHVVGMDGSSPRLLARLARAYAWSPDGKHILASSLVDEVERYKKDPAIGS